MSIKTNTNCKECLHKDVCAFLNRPTLAVEEITEKLQTDTNALNIIVSCEHFREDIGVKIRPRNFSGEICPSCHGTGMTTPENKCGYCNGKGIIEND